MAVMLIVTLGSRDVFLDKGKIDHPRKKGEEILNAYETYAKRLSYPIIQPAINYLFEQEKIAQIDRVILVCTDQPETVGRKYRDQDTIYFARILHNLLKAKYPSQISEIKLCKITQNPTLLDEMFEFFKQALAKDKIFQMDNLEKCYLELSGGVPGANTALLLQAIRYYREKCVPLYVSEATEMVFPLEIGMQILEDYKEEIFYRYLETYNYAGISKILEHDPNKALYYFIEYARFRLYFDFDSAQQALRNGIQYASFEEREIFEKEMAEVRNFPQSDYATRLGELYWNLWIKYYQKEYVDFLGRLYRFEDALLRTSVERWLGLSMEYDEATQSYKAFIETLNSPSHQELKIFLQNQKDIDGSPLVLDRVDIPLLTACLKFLAEIRKDEKAKSVVQFCQDIRPLIRLRHQTILAHGFEGVCEESIREKYPNGDLLNDLRTQAEAVIGKPLGENPFDRINQQSKKLLKK